MSFYRGMTCENVTIKGDKGTPITAYVARPSGPGPFPGVVLVHHLPGEAGFMWIRYRSNYIGMGAAWLDASRVNATPAVRADAEQMKVVLKSLSLKLDIISQIR